MTTRSKSIKQNTRRSKSRRLRSHATIDDYLRERVRKMLSRKSSTASASPKGGITKGRKSFIETMPHILQSQTFTCQKCGQLSNVTAEFTVHNDGMTNLEIYSSRGLVSTPSVFETRKSSSAPKPSRKRLLGYYQGTPIYRDKLRKPATRRRRRG